MTETEHKRKLSEIGKQVQNSKNLLELCNNLNAYEVAHEKARRDYPSLTTFRPDKFDLENLPSFGGATPPDNKNIFSWDEKQYLVLSPGKAPVPTGIISFMYYILEDRRVHAGSE